MTRSLHEVDDPLWPNAQSVDERTMGWLGEQHEVVVADVPRRKGAQPSTTDVGGNQTLEHRKCFEQRVGGFLLGCPQGHVEPGSLAMLGVVENFDDATS